MDEKIIKILEELLKGQERLEKKFGGLEKRFVGLEQQVGENTQILKALEHAAEVNKADHDKMAYDIAEIKRDFNVIEAVTIKNWSDIKAIKNFKS